MEDDEIIYKKQKKAFYFLLTIAVLFTIFYNTLYFSFVYKGKIIKSSTSVGADDAGFTYTKRSVMSKRYFVRVFCDDLQVNRVQWDIPVPDSLNYVPVNGWGKIPYELDKLKNL
jgi:hypothetical protein